MRYLPEIRKYKFIFDFLQNRKVYPFYDRILNTTNKKAFYDGLPNESSEADNLIHIVHYIPPFLKPEIGNQAEQRLITFKFPRAKGFMVNLNGYTSIDQYLSAQLSSKRRKNLRSYVRKLETCFKIRYEFYFGEIQKKRYDLLMAKGRLFLQNRFEQKGETHELLASWDFIEKTTYELILLKRASLFVIYNNEEPISVCLNYHHDTIFHNAIGSYDIAYSKFSLGYVAILRQLEWCLANGILLFDLSLGDLDYKRIWSNVIYDFEHQILYKQKNHLNKLVAGGLVSFYQLKDYLKRMKVDTLYHKLRRVISKEPKPGNNSYSEQQFELVDLDLVPLTEQARLVDLNHESYAFLRKPVVDFQFSSEEKSEDIKIYQVNGQKDRFYILGRNARQQLILR